MACPKKGERCWRGWKQNSCVHYVFPKCYLNEEQSPVVPPTCRSRAMVTLDGRIARPQPSKTKLEKEHPVPPTPLDAYLRKCSQMDMANRCRVVKQEMRRGRVPSRCDCDKRNGLQDQCGSKGFKCPTEVMEDKMREWETREDRRKNEDTPGGEPCCCCRARWHLERHQSGGCEDHMQPKIDLSNYSLVYVPSSWLPTKIDNPVVVDDRNFKRPNELR